MHNESMEVNEKEEFLFFPMKTNTLQKRQQFLSRPPSKEKCKELEKQYLNSKETKRELTKNINGVSWSHFVSHNFQTS